MTLWTVLGLGFMLGLRHATDADHVVAVSTIVARTRTLRSALLVGTLWGLGHTLTILLVGGAIVVFHVVVPPALETALELSVALMLVVLGVLNARSALSVRGSPQAERVEPPSAPPAPGWRPLAIGVVHGLAGSAAIALLVLATIEGVGRGLLYLSIFGAGTIAGMGVLTCLVVLPVAAAARRYERFERYLAGVTGVGSFVFGVVIGVRAVVGEG